MSDLTPEQRLALVVEVYDWLVKHTETWEVGYGDKFWDILGAEIAYLLGAIAKGHGRIELEEYGGSVDEPSGSPLHRVLIDPAYHEDCGPPAAVWDYIEVMVRNEKEGP